MKSKIILGLVFLGGLILILVWIQGGFRDKIPGGHQSIDRPSETPLKTFTIQPEKAKEDVTVSGTVTSREIARIAARVQGHVLEIKADAGDRVKKGDLLVKLDAKEAKERQAQAQATLESAKVEFEKAKSDLDRYTPLAAAGSISQKDFDSIKARSDTAKAAVQRAQAALDEALAALSYSMIKAPFDGIIAQRDANLGDLLTPGKLVMTEFMPGSLEMQAAVGEQYAAHVKVGSPVTLKIPSLGLTYDSKIREVVPKLDERSRTVTVKANLPTNPALTPGLYGTLSFQSATTEVIAIPASAVRTVGQLATVKVVEGKNVRVRNVKIGQSMGAKVEVLSGLKKGEKVVLPVK